MNQLMKDLNAPPKRIFLKKGLLGCYSDTYIYDDMRQRLNIFYRLEPLANERAIEIVEPGIYTLKYIKPDFIRYEKPDFSFTVSWDQLFDYLDKKIIGLL